MNKTPVRGAVTVVPRGPEGKTLRGGGGGRNLAAAVEKNVDSSGAGAPERFHIGSPAHQVQEPTRKQGITAEYDALDQCSSVSAGSAEAAIVHQSAAQVATAAVAAAMALEDEGVSDSTAGVLRELRASGMFTDLPDLAGSTASNAPDSLAAPKAQAPPPSPGDSAGGPEPPCSPLDAAGFSGFPPHGLEEKQFAVGRGDCDEENRAHHRDASELNPSARVAEKCKDPHRLPEDGRPELPESGKSELPEECW